MAYFAHNNAVAAVPPMPAEIAQAISAVMGAVGRLAKESNNSHGGYRYASADAFYAAIGPLCAAAGLIVKPVRVGRDNIEVPSKSGTRQMMQVAYRFRLIHVSGATWTDPDDVREVEVDRTGAQAFGAAESYVLKSYLRSLLMVPTGEADADAQELLETETRKASVRAAIETTASRVENIPFDLGQGLVPVPVDALPGLALAHARTLTTAAAFDSWRERNKHGRAQFHAGHKAQALALGRELAEIRKGLGAEFRAGASNLMPDTTSAASSGGAANGHG